MRYVLFLALMVLAVLPVSGLQAEDNKSNVDTKLQKEIDTAIQKGAEYLLKHWKNQPGKNEPNFGEGEKLFCLYALLHADLPLDRLKEQLMLLQKPYQPNFAVVYEVPILIFVLNLLDPVKYQNEIAECAQFLIDTQTPDGQWGYPVTNKRFSPVQTGKVTVTPSKNGKSVIDQLPRIKLIRNNNVKNVEVQSRGGGANNSCTQFALLGLSAATQANIEIPKDVWEHSLKYWQKAQYQDGGWGYQHLPTPSSKLQPRDTSYGSMTCAGISSLVICLRQLGKDIKDIKKDTHIQGGLNWILKNFSVTENPLVSSNNFLKGCFYYYLYSLERAMTLSETEMLDEINWYKKGAQYLVSYQDADGGWSDTRVAGKDELEPPALRTVYAILFLKRASRVYITPLGRGKAVVTPSSTETPQTTPTDNKPKEENNPKK